LDYQDRVKRHLADYKQNVLGISENGIWKRNQKEYSHILPVEQYHLNLLENYREALMAYIEAQRIKLHQDFHHLNSSQAACLNFFYPLIQENQISLLLLLLGVEGEGVQCEFEKVIINEEGTNFDFYIKLQSGRQLFFEIKFSENEFGKVKDEDKYRQKYEAVYKDRLAGKLKSGLSEYQTLIQNYQLLRNISYVSDENEDLLIIICPTENKKLHKEYGYVVDNVIVPSLHNKVRMITWETLLEEMAALLQNTSKVPDRLVEHYEKFGEKYILTSKN
jgi:hypothetical protein